MSHTLKQIPAAVRRFGEAVSAVPDDAWSNPTPCSSWTVRDLANHLVSEHRWAPHILRGESIESVGDRYDGDLVGDDPRGAWHTAADESIRAFQDVESPEMPVRLSFGTVPAEEYAGQMLTDLVVHGWDLARGAGVDDRMDPETVETALEYAQSRSDIYAKPGPMFAGSLEVDSDDPQDRLLALLGRDPNWSGR